MKKTRLNRLISLVLVAMIMFPGSLKVTAAEVVSGPGYEERTGTDENEEAFSLNDNLLEPVASGDASKIHKPRKNSGETVTTWDCIWFGNYWQEDTNGDGYCYAEEIGGYAADAKQPVKWRVLDIDSNGNALLLADKLIDIVRYNEEYADVTWETCTMRSYLNGYDGSNNDCKKDFSESSGNRSFIHSAFNEAERKCLIKGEVKNPNNPVYATDGGNTTYDWLFCLSLEEAMNGDYGFIKNEFTNGGSKPYYTDSDPTRIAVTTKFTDDKPGYYGHRGGTVDNWWWLRSPGSYSTYASVVEYDGEVNISSSGFFEYSVISNSRCVRPAFRMNLSSSSSLWKYAGTVCSDGTVDPVVDGIKKPLITDRGVSTWDCIWFGNYWQEDTNGDGKCFAEETTVEGTTYPADNKQPIKWRVLDIDDYGNALLLADKLIDIVQYNEDWSDVTWKTCTMRSYLNGYDGSKSFIYNAFSDAEIKYLIKGKVENPGNFIGVEDDGIQGISIYEGKGGDTTHDWLFCLSLNESMNRDYGFIKNKYTNPTSSERKYYTDDDSSRVAVTTKFTEDKLGYEGDAAGMSACWWLRSTSESRAIFSVSKYGVIHTRQIYGVSNRNICVRPAFRMNLSSSSSLWTYAGTVSSDETENEHPSQSDPDKSLLKSVRFVWEKPGAVSNTGSSDEFAAYGDNKAKFVWDEGTYYTDTNIAEQELPFAPKEMNYIFTHYPNEEFQIICEVDDADKVDYYQLIIPGSGIGEDDEISRNGKFTVTFSQLKKFMDKTDGGEARVILYPKSGKKLKDSEVSLKLRLSSYQPVSMSSAGNEIGFGNEVSFDTTGVPLIGAGEGDDGKISSKVTFSFPHVPVRYIEYLDTNGTAKASLLIGSSIKKAEELGLKIEMESTGQGTVGKIVNTAEKTAEVIEEVKKFNENLNESKLKSSTWNDLFTNLAGGESKDGKFLSNSVGSSDVKFEYSGILEASYSLDGTKYLLGNMMVGVKGTAEWDFLWYVVGAKIELTPEVKAAGGLKYEIPAKGDATLSGELSWDGSLTLTAKAFAGIPNVAEGGAYGDGTAYVKLSIIPEIVITEAKLEGKLGFYYNVLGGIAENRMPFGTGEYDILTNTFSGDWGFAANAKETGEAMTSVSAYDEDSYEYSDREYIASQSGWLESDHSRGLRMKTSGTTVQTLMSDTSFGAAPKIKSNGSTSVVAYLYDDGESINLNRNHLMYIVKSKENGWKGTPVRLNASDEKLDVSHSLYSNGSDIFLISQHARKLFSGSEAIDDITKELDIAVSRFDPVKKAFSVPEIISDKTQYNLQPVMGRVEGKTVAAWITNEDPAYFAQNATNEIECSVFEGGKWSEPVTVKENLNCITGMAIENNRLYYTVDGDNKLHTRGDVSLYSCSIDGSDTSLVAGSGRISGLSRMDDVLGNGACATWIENNMLRYAGLDGTIKNAFEEGYVPISDNYFIFGDRLFYVGENGNGSSNIYQCLGSGDHFGAPVPMTDQDKKYERMSMDIVDGAFEAIFMVNDVKIESDSMDITSDIACAVLQDFHNIELADADCSPLEAVDGIVPVTLLVENHGSTDVAELTVTVTDKDNVQYYQDKETVSVPSGEQESVRLNIPLPATLSTNQYTVTVAESGLSDSDMSDNSKTIQFGYSDIKFNYLVDRYEGDDRVVYYSVENAGNIAATETGLEVLVNGNETPVIADNIGTLDSGATFEGSFKLLPEWIDDNGNTLLNYRLNTATQDYYDYNNSDSVEYEYYNRVLFNSMGGTECGAYRVHRNHALDEIPVTSKEGDTFLGWYPSAEGDGDILTRDTKISLDVVYYAKWKSDHSEAVTVNKISLNTDKLSLSEGKSSKLTVSYEPVDATETSFTWKSDDEGVAVVDQTGLVHAIKEGSANITVATVDGEKTATCRVTVTKEGTDPDPDPSEQDLKKDIDVDSTDRDFDMLPGEIRRLPINKTGKYVYGVSYVSSDPKTVSVKNGVVTAKNLKKGETEKKATVTATYNGESIPFVITVKASLPAITAGQKGNKITAPKTVKADVGTIKTVTVTVKLPKSLQGNATVKQSKALQGKSVKPDKTDYGFFTLEETSPDSKGTKVSFKITPKEAGAAYIVWTLTDDSGNKSQAYTKVLIKKPISTLSVNGFEAGLDLNAGEAKRLIVTTTKGNTDPKNLSFSVKGKGVKVSKSGFVTAITPGATADVTVKAGKYQKTVTVKVKDHTGSILGLNKTSVNVKLPKQGAKPKTVALKVTMPKKDPPKVIWSITDTPKGITVDSDGKVTVTSDASPGCYTVAATPEETDSGYNSVCCEVIVK